MLSESYLLTDNHESHTLEWNPAKLLRPISWTTKIFTLSDGLSRFQISYLSLRKLNYFLDSTFNLLPMATSTAQGHHLTTSAAHQQCFLVNWEFFLAFHAFVIFFSKPITSNHICTFDKWSYWKLPTKQLLFCFCNTLHSSFQKIAISKPICFGIVWRVAARIS